MTDRISTFSLTSNITRQTMRLQTDYASTTQQQSSGQQSANFTGIATQAQPLLNLQTQFNRITAQVASIGAAQDKLTAMQDAMQGISDLVNRIMSQVNSAISDSTLSAETVSGWRDELANLLNTKVAGEYVFAGSDTASAAIDLTATPYYQGDTNLPSVRVSDSLRITYGVTADNAAFSDLFDALDSVIANPTDQTVLSAAYTKLSSSYDKVANISGKLAASGASLDQQAELQTATLDYLDTNIADINAVDLAATSLKLTQIETQLEASYSSLATLLNLKLSDYLR